MNLQDGAVLKCAQFQSDISAREKQLSDSKQRETALQSELSNTKRRLSEVEAAMTGSAADTQARIAQLTAERYACRHHTTFFCPDCVWFALPFVGDEFVAWLVFC